MVLAVSSWPGVNAAGLRRPVLTSLQACDSASRAHRHAGKPCGGAIELEGAREVIALQHGKSKSCVKHIPGAVVSTGFKSKAGE